MLKEIDAENEKELEQLLIKEPRYLEDGIKILKNQFPTPTGPLDILFLDAKKVVGIIEIKKGELTSTCLLHTVCFAAQHQFPFLS